MFYPTCAFFIFSTFFFFSSGATFQFSGKDARTGKIVEVKRDGVIPISGTYSRIKVADSIHSIRIRAVLEGPNLEENEW
jgi:hypothetical protein